MRGRRPKTFNSPLSEAEEAELADFIADTAHDPLGYTLGAYDWGQGDLSDFESPKMFQARVLKAIGDHLSNPVTRFHPLKIAVASGKGIGKTALIALITNWALAGVQGTRMRITANTEDQLRLIVWPEIRKWHERSINAHWFEPTATALYSSLPNQESQWRADAVTWSMNNLEAFAGFHNYGKRLVAIIDEGSGIADGVFDNMEGFLTDANTELIVIVFGNPTKNYGRFFDIFHGKNAATNGWLKFKIDSRTVEGMNLKQIENLAREYGEDSDIFKVTVKGEFPQTSFEQFIANSTLEEAMTRDISRDSQYKAPLILGVDPAYSVDDVAIVARQGLWCEVVELFKKTSDENDEVIAHRVAYWEDELRADAVNIDLGWGTGVKTVGDQMNRRWKLFAFGAGSPKPTYRNLRAYMYGELKDWLKEGGSLNGDSELKSEIAMPEKRVDQKGKVLVESKDDMKKRLGKAYKSPGRADALALTFARPVLKKAINEDYHPYERDEGLDYLRETVDPRG